MILVKTAKCVCTLPGNLDVGGEVDDGIKTPKLPIRGLRIVKKP